MLMFGLNNNKKQAVASSVTYIVCVLAAITASEHQPHSSQSLIRWHPINASTWLRIFSSRLSLAATTT